MLKTSSLFLSALGMALALANAGRAEPSWTPVTISGLRTDNVKVFGPNCKGDTGQTLTRDAAKTIMEARLRPSGGCVQLLLQDAAGQADAANPKYVLERLLDIPDKPVKPIACPPGVTMTERDKTSNTAMGLGGECRPSGPAPSN